MEGTEYTYQRGDRLRLKDTVDSNFYGGYACVGNEAIVKRREKDNYDLPKIYVEWDKNHWTYNGAPDCWTFEDHFELVKGIDMPDENLDSDQIKQLREILERIDPSDRDEKREQSFSSDFQSNQESDRDEQYNEAIQTALAMLEECEAFVVVGVTRQEHPEAPKGVLIPTAISFAKTPEGELLAMSGATQFGAKAHQELTLKAITALSE
jgi:hypothetical protein